MRLNVESTLDRMLKAQSCPGMPFGVELAEMMENLKTFIQETESQLGLLLYVNEETKQPYPFAFKPYLHKAMRDYYIDNPHRSVFGESIYDSNLKHAISYIFEPLIDLWGNKLTHAELLSCYESTIDNWIAQIHAFDEDVDEITADISRRSLFKENVARRNFKKAVNAVVSRMDKQHK